MNSNELRIGSLIKYKDKVCTIKNINGTDNTVYMKYSNEYFCSAKIEELEPIEIDIILLCDAGFDEEFPGYFKYETDKYVYIISMRPDNWEIIIKEDNCTLAFATINYYHQLQMICGIYED